VTAPSVIIEAFALANSAPMRGRQVVAFATVVYAGIRVRGVTLMRAGDSFLVGAPSRAGHAGERQVEFVGPEARAAMLLPLLRTMHAFMAQHLPFRDGDAAPDPAPAGPAPSNSGADVGDPVP
jgi:hypothetical protein